MSESSLPARPQVALRPVLPGDSEFLFLLYSTTRQEELEATGWDARQRAAFLQMQFQAQQSAYRSMFPDAQFQIILRQGERVGWMVIHRSPTELRVVDLALLPAHRSCGIGSALLKDLLADARRAALPVRLHVLKANRAARLYTRLGFQTSGQSGFHD